MPSLCLVSFYFSHYPLLLRSIPSSSLLITDHIQHSFYLSTFWDQRARATFLVSSALNVYYFNTVSAASPVCA